MYTPLSMAASSGKVASSVLGLFGGDLGLCGKAGFTSVHLYKSKDVYAEIWVCWINKIISKVTYNPIYTIFFLYGWMA